MRLISGELALRSGESVKASSTIPSELEGWLVCLTSVEAASSRCDRSLERIRVLAGSLRSLRVASRVARESVVAEAAAMVKRARERCERERLAQEMQAANCAEASEAALAKLVLRYGAVLAAERVALRARESEAQVECGRACQAMENRRRLTLFGLRVEHETRGACRLKRLHGDDAQLARCRRAATENVRRHYFEQDGASIEVLDVYKVDNRRLLEHFHAQSEGNKVKGLFCTLPEASVERVATFGFRSESESQSIELALFEADDASPARTAAMSAASPSFPRPFSRYSTAHELRAEERADTSTIRFLALCRVLLGRVAVGSNEDPQADTLFAPHTEEYLPRRAEHVLPEFLIAYRFKRAPCRSVLSALDRGSLPRLALYNAGLYSINADDIDARAARHADVLDNASVPHLALSTSSVLPRESPKGTTPQPAESSLLNWDVLLNNADAERRAIVRAVSNIVASIISPKRDPRLQAPSLSRPASASSVRSVATRATSSRGRPSSSSAGARLGAEPSKGSLTGRLSRHSAAAVNLEQQYKG